MIAALHASNSTLGTIALVLLILALLYWLIGHR